MEQRINSREYDRSPVELAVTLTLPDGALHTGTTATVGMGGFSVDLAELPPVGTRVAAELRFGDGPHAVIIRSAGHVVWRRDGRAGIAFCDTDADNTKKLRDLFLYNPTAAAWE